MEIVSAIITMLGGLAMFLYGIEVMGDGLKNSSGAALKRVLEKLTGNVITGILTGTLVTAVIQSSTATIVLAVALIGAGVLTLKQAVSIVMGANIGTTVTAWITNLAFMDAGGNWLLWLFDTDTLAPIALFLGVVLIMFVKSKKAKLVGDISIGFGILFVGLMSMTGAVKGFANSPVFMEALASFSNTPVLGILAGLVLTVIVQSSSATVAMLQSLSATGAMDFSGVYPIVMGINIGTCIVTAFYCFVGESHKDSRRTGVVHVAFNTIGTVAFMIILSIMQHFQVFGAAFWHMEANSTVIAVFQSLFNVFTCVLLLPFINQLVKLSVLVVKDEPEKETAHPELLTLTENLYISPAVALGEATKAVAAMGALARENFYKGCQQLKKYDEKLAQTINDDEDCLDQFADRADQFLIGLSKSIESERDDRQLDMLMQTVPNFERVGDYATNFVELAQRLDQDKTAFSESARKELEILGSAVIEILDLTVDAFANSDNDKAKAIEPLEETIDDMVMILRDRHTKRLKMGACSVSSGLVFMEVLTYMERASDQCSSIAMMMLARDNESILQNHHEYLREIHAGNDARYNAEKERRREQYIAPLKTVV
ncbi:MAG: Na/Pi cotransporter family protein [Oscillospiraceae bacterium]|nr:Na/Pi cotransporter family protein [Oscillospiraceae bacterium]